MSRRGASELAILKEAEDQAAEIVTKARDGSYVKLKMVAK